VETGGGRKVGGKLLKKTKRRRHTQPEQKKIYLHFYDTARQKRPPGKTQGRASGARGEGRIFRLRKFCYRIGARRKRKTGGKEELEIVADERIRSGNSARLEEREHLQIIKSPGWFWGGESCKEKSKERLCAGGSGS